MQIPVCVFGCSPISIVIDEKSQKCLSKPNKIPTLKPFKEILYMTCAVNMALVTLQLDIKACSNMLRVS